MDYSVRTFENLRSASDKKMNGKLNSVNVKKTIDLITHFTGLRLFPFQQVDAANLGFEPKTMRPVAPLGWEHPSLTGVYTWDGEDRPAKGAMRPLRTKPSLLAA